MDDLTAVYGGTGPPRPGDLSVCLSCGAPLEFPDDGTAPRWLTYDDVSRLSGRSRYELVSVILAVLTVRKTG